MRFFSRKTREKNKISIFRALKSKLWSFSSGNNKILHTPVHGAVLSRYSSRLVTLLLTFGICTFFSVYHLLFAAQSEVNFRPEATTINVFPSEVTSLNWKNVETIGTQELSGSSLFQEFNTNNSAYIEIKKEQPRNEVPIDSNTEILDGDENDDTQSEATPGVPVNETETGDSEGPSSSEEGLETSSNASSDSETSPIPTVESEVQGEPAIEESSYVEQPSLLSFFKRVTGVFPFTQAATTVSVSSGDLGGEDIGISEPTTSENETTIWPSTEENPQDSFIENEEVPTVTGEVDADLGAGEVVKSRKANHSITLRDFGISTLASGQFIENLQLRISLAGQYDTSHPDPAFVSVDYSLGGFSRDAGSIFLDSEFSNAINGGYYLIPLPSITDPELLKDLVITISFDGEESQLRSLYVDAAWLEVGTVVFNKELLKERFSTEEMLKHLEGLQTMELLSDRLDFLRDELPQFNLRYTSQRNIFVQAFRNLFGRDLATIQSATFTTNDGEPIPVNPEINITPDGLISIVLTDSDKERLKPGMYEVLITLNEGGYVATDSFEFQWGMLSINSNQTEYSQNDVVHISMGALSPNGNTLCEANLNLYITDPNGFIANAPVISSGQCFGNNVIDVPDYSAQFVANGPGVYEMYLERVDEVGNVISHTSDTFLVRDMQQLTIERNGPTRIYPPASYPMEITVHAIRSSFEGELIERVPNNFRIFNTDALIRPQEGYIELVWDISVEAGTSTTVSYDFDAPDLSPYLYELGPAKLVGERESDPDLQIDLEEDEEVLPVEEETPTVLEEELPSSEMEVEEPALIEDDQGTTSEPVPTETSESSAEEDGPEETEEVPTVEEEVIPEEEVESGEETPNEDSSQSEVESVMFGQSSYISLFKPASGDFLLAQAETSELTLPTTPVSGEEDIEETVVLPETEVENEISNDAVDTFDDEEEVEELPNGLELPESDVVFLEHRQWQIASDATGNMVLYWDNASTIPSGWTCLSCGSGAFYQNFAQGNSTYNTTGGATTHTPTATGAVTASAMTTIATGGSNTTAVTAHTHTFTPIIASGSNLPSYRQLRVIQYTDGAGEPPSLPAGAIGIFDVASSSLPSGWTRYAAQDGYYVRGEDVPGTTGGSNTHTHAITGTTGNAAGGNTGAGAGANGAAAGHNHTLSTSTASMSNEPPYIEVLLGKIMATGTPPNNLIAMWTDTVPTGWTDVSSGGADPFNSRFIKASTTYGGTGGTTNHQHANVNNASSSLPSATATDAAGAIGSSNLHTHKISITGFSNVSHLPPYLTVIFGKRADFTPWYTQLSSRWYVNTNASSTPTDVWPLGTTTIAEGEAITATSSPVKQGEVVRLRINASVSNASSSAGRTFMLQYGEATSTCSAIPAWSNVGASTSSVIWRGYDNVGVTDHILLSSTTLATSSVKESYEENGFSTGTPNTIPVGTAGEWDFVLQNNGAAAGTNYCFRMVLGDSSPLYAYTSYPRLLTNQVPNTPVQISPFDNERYPTTTTQLSFRATDLEDDRLEYELVIDNNFDFSSPTLTKFSSNYPTDTGWASSTFAAGATTTYSIQPADALVSGTTYWWRLRVRDPLGSDLWSATSTIQSFTVNTAYPDRAWHQTLGLQFEDGTLSNVSTTTNNVGLSTTSRSVPVVAGFTSNTATTTASVSLTKPANVEVGDLLIILVGNDDNTATAQWDNATLKPAGFTLINEAGNATPDTHVAAFYRVVDGTESTATSVPSQAAVNNWGYYLRVTGASTTNPVNATGADYAVNNLVSHPVTSVNTTQSNTLAFYILGGDALGTAPFSVSGTGWSQSAEITVNTGGTWGTRSMVTAGATGAATVNMSANDGASAFQFAINPSNPRGTIMSPEVDFDWISGQTDWGDVNWSVTEPPNTDTLFKLYYSSTTTCDTPVPNSALPGNTTGFDASASGFFISSLSTTTYNRLCLRMTFDLGQGTSTPTLNDWTLGWVVPNQIPYTPNLALTPAFEYAKSTSTQPVFGGFASTDYESNALEYEIIIDDDYTLTSPATTSRSTQYPGDAGWSAATFASGATTTYRVQSSTLLTEGSTYWWAVRARDPSGTNTWSATSSPRSITIGSGNSVAEWYQTTDKQFTFDTLSNATTSGNAVRIETLGVAATTITTQSAWSQQYATTTYPSGVVNASYSIGGGTNRVLVVAIGSTRSAVGTQAVSVSYGGQALTQAAGDGTNALNPNHSYLFYLNDAGISAATNTNLSVTVTGGTSVYTFVYASVFAGVEQSSVYTAARNYFSGATANVTVGPFASALTVGTGDQAIEVINLARSTSGAGARTVATWSNATWPAPSTVAVTYSAGSGYGVGLHINNRNATTAASETSGHTANSAGTFDSMTGMSLKVAGTGSYGYATSTIIDHDFVPGQNTWGEIGWETTEPTGSDTKLRVYYATSTLCNTMIPDGTLPGNAVGFDITQSPINISSLSTSTYNRICLVQNFEQGASISSPSLDDWAVRWVRAPQFAQDDYRWYANVDSLTPTDPWPVGGVDLAENEAIDIESGVLTGGDIRLRMSLMGTSTNAAIGSASFKLQFAAGETCSADLSWQDVGDTASTTALWRGYNNASIADATTIPSLLLTDSDVMETYEERNNSYPNVGAITVGQNGEWDWTLYNNMALAGTQYCFRMVSSDGSVLRTYGNYPTLMTNSSPDVPTLVAPFDNERLASTSPWFDFITNDPEGNELDYQIQIDNDSNFSSTVIDTDSESNLDDFLNVETPSDKTPFDNAAEMRYIIPSALTNGTTYWWRVRSKDAAGSNTYSNWSTAQSFTVATSTTITTWFQTTEAQFDTNTLQGTDATGGNLVSFASGSTTGTTTSTAIDFSNATVGNAWGTFTFNETGAANNILYHLEYYSDGVWETIPNSALPGNVAGFDTSPVDIIDLDTSDYGIIRIRANFNAGSPTLLDWTVTWGERVSVPTHIVPFDNERFSTTTPTFTFYTTDPQNNDLEYEISWSTDYTFTTGTTTRNSSSSPTGFTNLTTGSDTSSPYISGDTIAYKVQPANVLSASTTYWWRVRAKDPGFSNSYSFWSDPWSFTTATSGESIVVSTWFQTLGLQFDKGTLTGVTTATGSAGVTGGITVESSFTSNTGQPNITLSLTRPSDVETGDLLLILVGNDNTSATAQWNNTTLKPTGFTLINTAGNATPDAHVAAFYRVADGSEGTSINVPAQSSFYYWGYYIRVTGVDTSNPIDVTGVDYAVNNLLSHGIPSVTTTVDQALAFYLLGADGGDTYPFSVSGAGWTESAEIQAGTLGTNAAGTWGTRNVTTAGASGVATVTMAQNDGASGFQFALRPAPVTSGVIKSPSIDFNDGNGPAWGSLSWRDTEPGSSQILYQLEYLNGVGDWELIPDSALSGNAAGFTNSPVNIETLNTTTYNEIRIVGNLNCSGANCPTLNEWKVEWSRGFTISGTALEYDGLSSTTAGTVGVAVNGVLQLGKTGSVQVDGTWTISDVTFFSGDVVTVFVSGATDANEAVAVTKYDGTPNITGMRLQKRRLTIGSDDLQTITNTNIGEYDFSDSEDLFYDVDLSSDLTMCATTSCGDAGIIVMPRNTYSPGTGADAITHDFTNNGTFIPGSNNFRVSGSWDDNATSTLTGSTIIFTATSSTETVDETGATTTGFNNLTFGETSGTATWNLQSALDINGNLAVTYGTLGRNSRLLTVAGNLTTNANGYWTGMGTTTFDGSNPGTWTDNNAVKQNIGRVQVEGTSKTLLLGGSVLMQSLLVGADDTFDAVSAYTASVYGNWINNNTFHPRTGTVTFIATTTNQVITVGGDNFYNLTINGAGGSWSFTESTLGVSNDFSIATGTITMPTATTTISGSFTNTGGTFAHNNSVVYFNTSSAKTITQGGTAFTNAFYNVQFSGTGSWVFTEGSASTSNNFTITQGSVTMPTTTLTIGGDFINSGGSFTHNSGTIKFTSAAAKTIDTNAAFYSLLFAGVGSWSFVDSNVTVANNLTTASGTLTLPSGTMTLGGSFTNTATITHNSGTVLFNATTTGKTISTGTSTLYNMTFNSGTGGWTISSSATATNNVTLASLGAFTLASGQTLAVGGVFTNSVGGASTTWTGSTLSLESGTYSINAKTNTGDSYGTLRTKANTNIKMWNSSSTVYAVNSTGSLYSQDHSSVDGDLYIYGNYIRTSGTEYWNYATDFDGTSLGTSSARQVDVRFDDSASATFSSGSVLQILGTSTATTSIDKIATGYYGLTVASSSLNALYYQFKSLNATGLNLTGSSTVTSLANGQFEVSAASGTAMTVSSSTINANAALPIYYVNFTSTLSTTTPSYWLAGWDYRKSHTLTSSTGAGTNYQMRLLLHYGAGTDSGADVYLNSKSKTDFSDIRFTTDSGTTTIDYWVASSTNATVAEVWVEIPADLSSSNQTIYIYYGNSSAVYPYLATERAHGDATFLFFDNFSVDLSRWQREVVTGIYPVISNTTTPNYVRNGGGITSGAYGFTSLGSNPTYTGFNNNAVGYKARNAATAIGSVAFRGSATTTNTGYQARFDQRTNEGQSFLRPPYNTWNFLGSCAADTLAPAADTWYQYEVTADGSNFRLYRNGTLMRNCTDATYSSAGQISLQNHYGTHTDYDWVYVRKFQTTEPGHGSWGSEEPIPLSSGTNVTAVGTSTSYWRFWEHTGALSGESYDNDPGGNPGYIRWDDSALTITVSGTVYSDDGVTAMGAPTCNGATANVTVIVYPGTATSTWCTPGTGAYSINVPVVGDVTLTTYLNTNGGQKGVVVTKTPTANISNHNIYANRVITKHQDVLPLTIADMAKVDSTDDSDIPFTAASGTVHTLTLPFNTELHIASSTTFAPGGNITIYGNASGTSQDGSLHIDDNATFTGSATSTYVIGGSFTMDQGATFTPASTTVIMNATTTGKTITTTALQEIGFNNLQFTGVNGGWNINGNIRVMGNLDVATGTVTGTSNITIPNGSFSGNGTVSIGSGTTTIERSNTLGGTTPWTLANLVLGNGSVVGTTTPATNATTTILGKLTVSNAHYLTAGGSIWDLRGAGTAFALSGTFQSGTSTVQYSGTADANILSTNYYNLKFASYGGTPTYTATGIGIGVLNNLTVGGSNPTIANFNTNDTALDVAGNVYINTNGSLIGSDSGAFTVAGSWTNVGSFTHSNGKVTFDATTLGNTVAPGGSAFYDVDFNSASGGWTVGPSMRTDRNLSLLAAQSFVVATSTSGGGASWYDIGWSYRKKITIDHTKVGSTSTSTLVDFPVLINTTNTSFKYTASGGSVGKSNGGDILFTSSDGTTKLSHELEKYSSTTGETVAWVRVPLLATSTDTELYIYYGNSNATDQWNVASTWNDGGNGYYKGVFHMKEATGTNPVDSSPYGNNGTHVNSPGQVTGQIDGALSLNGTNQNIDTTYTQTNVTSYTVGAWVRTTDSGIQRAIVQNRGSGAGQSLTLGVGTSGGGHGAAGTVSFEVDSNALDIGISSVATIHDGNWHYVVGTWGAATGTAVHMSQFKIYIDGALAATTSGATGSATSPLTGLSGAKIGRHEAWATYLNGSVDEVRMATVVRSADWIKTEYNNQSAPSSFYAFGTESSAGSIIEVRGTFTNAVGGAQTTWTGSTLYINSGTNQSINTKSAGADVYSTLMVGSNTQVRMWNSSAGTTSPTSTASVYSQDHAGVDGALNIYGAYTKTTGNDYWSYATDFDGTSLTGSERKVDVYFSSSSSAVYTGGGLAVIGASTASTSIQNQGTGAYSLRIGGVASTTMSYYDMRNMTSSGLTFSGTPTVVNLSNGSFTVGIASGTAMTVGGTVLTFNPPKTFTNNSFGTTTGISAWNVTATGTASNPWRFTNHSGSIDGELFDVDPAGDPGYLVWDDGSTTRSISGRVFSDEGVTVSTACDGVTPNIRLRVAGLTNYTTTCNAGTGAYTFTGVNTNPGDSLIVYIDGEPEVAAVVTEDLISTLSNMDLYENRVIVRHEDIDPLSIADMAIWDSSDDADIPFTAVDSGSDTLTLPANRKLIVWTGTIFRPEGNVTLSGGGGGAAYDGTLELYTNAIFDATGAESHSIGGSFISGTGASFDDESSTVTFTTAGASRTIDTNDYAFYNMILNGSGSWNITNTGLLIANDLTITQGALTLPTGTTTITGSFTNSGGSFSQNGGRMLFNSGSAETIRTGNSSFGTTTFNGVGSWTYQGTNSTSTGDFIIFSGTVTGATGTLAVGGNFRNHGTYTHGSGRIRLTAPTASTTIRAGGSDLYAVTIAGSGSFIFTDTNVALLGTLAIEQGAVTLASGTLSIAGSFLNTGGSFNNASGTILFNSSDIGETINPGSSLFNTVSIAAPTGGYTITNNATTTGNFSLTSATSFTQQSGTILAIDGLFTNLVGGVNTTWTGSTLKIRSGSSYTVNSSTQGGDTYNILLLSNNTDLRMWNSVATTTMGDALSSLYSQDHAGVNGELNIYGDYTRTIGTDYWSYGTDFDGTNLAGIERAVNVRIASGATTTLYGGTLQMIGVSTGTTTVTNQGTGTYSINILGGTLYALNYAMRNMDVRGLTLSGTTAITSIAGGDFELAVSGGSLITVSSTTVNYNASQVISGVRFGTTTAITGTNVNLQGTTPAAWTFTNHRGNFDGEVFDNDGGDACGSIRWDDSACLLTQESAYRFRNDDGGEGVPDSEWFNLSWSNRERVTITNADASTYTNAAVKVRVPHKNAMQPDFEDLRFTDSTGITEIPYFIETYTASTEAIVWVKVPSLTASADTEVYMYYGNGAVGDSSNGHATFYAFDDFEDGVLTEYSGDTPEFLVNSSANVYEGTYSQKASSPAGGKTDFGGMYNNGASTTVSQGQTIRYFQYIDTTSGSGDESCTTFGTQNQTQNFGVCLELFGVDRMSLVQDVLHRDTSGTVLASTTVTYSTGWYEVEIDWHTSNLIAVSLYKNDVLVATTSASDNSYTTGGIGYTLWTYHGAWDIYTSRPLIATDPTVVIGGEQVPGGASWLAALNTKASGVGFNDVIRPRFLIENTGLTVSDQYRLMYATKGVSPSCESVSSAAYTAVPIQSSCGSSPICMQASQLTDQASTTDILGGNGTFTSGKTVENTSNTANSLTLLNNEYTEVEYAIIATTNATSSNYCLRVNDAGSPLDSYTRVAEIELMFSPNITAVSLNGGSDINLVPGATTTIYATGTVTDMNGYADLNLATTTMFRSGVLSSCTSNTNNCYIASPSRCSFNSCSGNSCNVSCSADFYYHADPTDIGTYAGQTWRAELSVSDQSGAIATGTAPSIDLLTLRAINVNSTINYGTLEVNANTGSYNATSTIENIGNDALDISIEGTDLSDGLSSLIPVNQQKFATSTFTYSSCVFCSQLSASPVNYELDLLKPTTTLPTVTDQLYWGIAIPLGVAGNAHQGTNIFYAIGD